MEAARVILARAIKKSGSMWTRVIPNIRNSFFPSSFSFSDFLLLFF